MANDRERIAMTPAEVGDFLRHEGRTAILATAGPDGIPDPLAMWYVVDDEGTIWMRTYAASQKAVNLRRDPRAAILVEAGQRYNELRGVQLTGRFELIDDVEVICDIFAALMVKYEGMDPAHVPAAREGYRDKAPKQVAMRFLVDRVVSWDHRK
jgi:PPOX class probable F420-dependent enzyme